MATKIRLARGGTKKRPFYRIVVADSRASRDGRFIEKIGTYDPLLPKDQDTRIELKKERLDYWLSVGAQPSERIIQLMKYAGIKSDTKQVKDAEVRHAKIVALKKDEIAARKKAEAEKKAAEDAEKKAAEDAAKAEAEAAAAEEAKKAEEQAAADKAAAEEAKSSEEAPAEEAAEASEESK